MSILKDFPRWYQEWNTLSVSWSDIEVNLFVKLYLWVDHGMVRAIVFCDEGGMPLLKEDFAVGHLESATICELLDSLRWRVQKITNEAAGATLVPVGDSQVRDWLLSLMDPNNRQWAIAALVTSGLKGFKVCTLKEAFRAIFWGSAERKAFCEQLGVSEAEFKGGHKAACKAADLLLKTAGPDADVSWFADWACSPE